MNNNRIARENFRSRFLKRMQRIVSAHRKFYIPCVVISAVVLFCYGLCCHIHDNRKRWIACTGLLLAFFASSSFAFPETRLSTGFVSEDSSDLSSASNDGVVSGQDRSASLHLDGYSKEDSGNVYDALLSELEENSSEEFDELEEIDETGVVKAEDQYGLSDLLEGDTITADIEEEETATEGGVFSKDDWQLILVNKQHPIPENYEFPLSRIKGNMYCDERIRSSLLQMFVDAQKDNVNLVICSPYRSQSHQERLFSRKITAYMDEGMDYMTAYTTAAQAVTIPGSSEHQIGLAVDIICDTYASLDEGFGETKAGKWLADNAYKYGFILRYPQGDEELTGIEYEPWHFRYVGKDAAWVIYSEDLCLEEFWNDYVYGN